MSSRAQTVSCLRIALAVVAWFGVLLHFWLSIRLANANGKSLFDALVTYFGYFTILTNLFVATMYSLPPLGISRRLNAWLASVAVKGCATTGILLVAISYHLLLREIWAPQGAQLLADVILHYLVPAGVLADWLLSPRREAPDWSLPLKWTAYPFIFLAYALVRGEIIGTYPYPFIDVSVLGYRQAVLDACVLLGLSLVLGFMLLGLSFLHPRAAWGTR
ncbi:MAG: Pr6Pr family membrane protein [Luteolibacter sp.]|jgi:hypothetical protein|nr:Pr6Pr family membrane protein [Luteolibacter sp.]